MLSKLIFDRVVIITALKGAFALTLAASVALYFHYQLFWWALFVSLISIQPDIGTSIMTLILRFLGAYIGAAIAITVSSLLQFPWLYYPLIIVFVYCCLYYVIQPDVPFAGIICFFTALSCLLAGPVFGGVVHYAIERCIQISFALLVVLVTLFLLRAQYAHNLLTAKISNLMDNYVGLWERIMQAFIHEKPEPIQPLVREISIELGKMYPLLKATRYERGKKKIDVGQCHHLLELLKRLLSLFTSLNEVSRYIKHEDFSAEAQAFMVNLNGEIVNALNGLKTLIAKGATYYQATTDKIEKEFNDLMDRRLAIVVKDMEKNPLPDLNRIAWFSIVQRLFHVLSLARKATVLMNANRCDPKFTERLSKEMRWLSGEEEKQSRINPVRAKLALHGTVAGTLILCFQQYYNWSPMYTMFALLIILYISLSFYNASTSNIGLGFLGGVCGFIYVYFASYILNYFPHYFVVLSLLFVGAFISAYFLLLSKMRGQPFVVFAFFFAICVIYMLTADPSQRGNFNFGVILLAGILSGVVVYSVVRRVVLPLDYKQMLRNGLSSILVHQALIIRFMSSSTFAPPDLTAFQNLLYQQSQRINKVRLYVQHCIDFEIFNAAEIQKIHQVTYSCELMLLSTISVLRPYFISASNEFVQTFYVYLQKEIKTVIYNLLHYAHNIRYNVWNKTVLTDVAELKKMTDAQVIQIIPKILTSSDYILHLRNIAVIYNAIHRLYDVQIRLINIKDFKF